ncbi:MAG: UDP-N-acetylmuramate dehydrogenase [Candidatus Paceibacterota bacterium]|jgi:UDP-N-acetylmuramate dehydrogenase
MIIQENISLAQYTTFRIGGPARYFCVVTNEDELAEAVTFAKDKKLNILVIGGGSNLLISDGGFNGLVIKIEIKGVKEHGMQDMDYELITAGAGEDWDELVEKLVNKSLYGLENLSSIPGTVGASPVQNIGAYGVEVSSVISSVHALDKKTMKFVELSNTDCHFSYRNSLFKEEKGRFIITGVTYKLSRKGGVNIEYRDLKEYFGNKVTDSPSPIEVRQAIVEIRKNKLPDWRKFGTAGSFFKNPIITIEQFEQLKGKYPEIPGYLEADGRVKISLGWVLDKLCDVKGFTIGNVGTYEKQALVIVAKSGATASEVLAFSNELIHRVKDKTGIDIEGEVEWVVA